MSGITGDFSSLRQLREKLRAMPAVYADIKERLAAETQRLVEDEFAEERGPDGRPWAQSRRAAEEGGLTLSDSGRLRSSFSAPSAVTPLAEGFAFGTNVKYAAVHQYGAVIRPKNAPRLRFRIGRHGRWVSARSVRIPKRPMLPEGGQLSPLWAAAYAQNAVDALRDHFEK